MASDTTDLRALAARVLGEEPSRELDADIWDALGLTYAAELAAKDWMRRHKNRPRRDYLLAWSPAFTASHDAAFGAMPAGWMVFGIAERERGGFDVTLYKPRHPTEMIVTATSPTLLPRAVTAAGLLARAAEMEEGG
jgi:CubicO group peptidase (beta-lactamase class C family)